MKEHISNRVEEIYLDHAAATPLDARVRRAMEPYWDDIYANPSSLYRPGRAAKEALDDSRETVAKILNCKANEIIFTSGGTEADNIGIFGATGFFQKKGGHLITTAFEHHAGLRSFETLERDGWAVTYLAVGGYGLVDIDAVKNAIRPDASCFGDVRQQRNRHDSAD